MIGSLFSGYGGLDLAAQSTFARPLAFVSDIEPGPCKILANHYPDVPNLGDVTAVDWAAVARPDIGPNGWLPLPGRVHGRA